MTTASLHVLSLQFTLALAVAAIMITSSAGTSRAATRPPMLASETGWPSELVNRPTCASDHVYDAHPACEAGRR
jgi:hypothetical protein